MSKPPNGSLCKEEAAESVDSVTVRCSTGFGLFPLLQFDKAGFSVGATIDVSRLPLRSKEQDRI
jgi:hypothetical protein